MRAAPIPRPTPLGFEGKNITGSLCHRHVGALWGLSAQKQSVGASLHSRKLDFVSGHRERLFT